MSNNEYQNKNFWDQPISESKRLEAKILAFYTKLLKLQEGNWEPRTVDIITEEYMQHFGITSSREGAIDHTERQTQREILKKRLEDNMNEYFKKWLKDGKE